MRQKKPPIVPLNWFCVGHVLLEMGTIANETPLEKTNFPCECHQLEIVSGLRMCAGVFFPSRSWYPICLRPWACHQSLWGHLSVLFRRLCFLGGLLIYLPLQSACLPLSQNSLSPEKNGDIQCTTETSKVSLTVCILSSCGPLYFFSFFPALAGRSFSVDGWTRY